MNKKPYVETSTNPKNQLLSSQQKLIEIFLANAGKEFVGKNFILSWQGKDKIKYFSCNQIGFSLNISDTDLLLLAQQGYLQVYVNPPSVIFTEKALEKTSLETDILLLSDNDSIEPQMQILKVDIIQVYAWLVASLVASAISLSLLLIVIQQLLNKNLTIGILSSVSTIASGFVATIFFKNYDKANERLKYLRSKSSAKRK